MGLLTGNNTDASHIVSTAQRLFDQGDQNADALLNLEEFVFVIGELAAEEWTQVQTDKAPGAKAPIYVNSRTGATRQRQKDPSDISEWLKSHIGSYVGSI
jgi:hypothetical protein